MAIQKQLLWGRTVKDFKRSWTRNAKHLASIWSLNPFDQICSPRIAISIVPAIVLLRAPFSVTNLALQQLMQEFYRPLVPLCSTDIRSEIQIWLFVKTPYNMHNHLQWIYQANFIHSVSIKVDNVLNVLIFSPLYMVISLTDIMDTSIHTRSYLYLGQINHIHNIHRIMKLPHKVLWRQHEAGTGNQI